MHCSQHQGSKFTNRVAGGRGENLKKLQLFLLLLVCLSFSGLTEIQAEEQSVIPGINSYYMDPDWRQWVNQFERPGREIYDRRFDILRASGRSAPGRRAACHRFTSFPPNEMSILCVMVLCSVPNQEYVGARFSITSRE